jgi:hypothetical protein
LIRDHEIYDCMGNLLSRGHQELWQAYPVRDPKNPRFPADWHDTFTLRMDGPCTRGVLSITGYVVFVTGWRPTPPDWKQGGDPGVGSLPYTLIKPPWWTDAGGRPHSMLINYDCCPCVPQESWYVVPSSGYL